MHTIGPGNALGNWFCGFTPPPLQQRRQARVPELGGMTGTDAKEDKEEAQCAQKWGRMLIFGIYGIIKNVLPNFYFILQIYQVKSFKMMHFMSQYFNFSIRYSWKCSKKMIELRLLSNYYPDSLLSFVALLRIFYQILISYCKFFMPKALKWGMLYLYTLIFQ